MIPLALTITHGQEQRAFALPSRTGSSTVSALETLLQLIRLEFQLDQDVSLALSLSNDDIVKDQGDGKTSTPILLPFDLDILHSQLSSDPSSKFSLRVYQSKSHQKQSTNSIDDTIPPGLPSNVVIATFAYQAMASSELSFACGDRIVVESVFNDDWLIGHIWDKESESTSSTHQTDTKKSGYFPANHVKGLERIDLVKLPRTTVTNDEEYWQDEEYFDGYANLVSDWVVFAMSFISMISIVNPSRNAPRQSTNIILSTSR